MKKLLIATTNNGKAKEIKQFLEDLPFEIIVLNDLDNIPEAPEETGNTLEQNALLKARYYAEKTGMMTLADDTGLFIEALDGWPAHKAGRVAHTADERCIEVLKKLKHITNRTAYFRSVVVILEPVSDTTFFARGEAKGEISIKDNTSKREHGFGYDPIFFLPDLDKTYDKLTTQEKNAISHRGKALIKIKRYLQNQYRGKHFVVPIAFIVRDGNILMNKRNDPFNPSKHGLWEFPGGSVEIGERIEEAVIKECREETGFDVCVISRLGEPRVKTFEYDSGDCQFYIVPYLCNIKGGELNPSDTEVLESSWVSYDEALALDKFPGDTEMMKEIRPLFEKLTKKHSL